MKKLNLFSTQIFGEKKLILFASFFLISIFSNQSLFSQQANVNEEVKLDTAEIIQNIYDAKTNLISFFEKKLVEEGKVEIEYSPLPNCPFSEVLQSVLQEIGKEKSDFSYVLKDYKSKNSTNSELLINSQNINQLLLASGADCTCDRWVCISGCMGLDLTVFTAIASTTCLIGAGSCAFGYVPGCIAALSCWIGTGSVLLPCIVECDVDPCSHGHLCEPGTADPGFDPYCLGKKRRRRECACDGQSYIPVDFPCDPGWECKNGICVPCIGPKPNPGSGDKSAADCEDSGLTLSFSFVENESLPDESDGKLTSSVSGGAPPYNYFWPDGDDSPNKTDLSAGMYCLTVTDAECCPAEVCALIEVEACLNEMELEFDNQNSCSGNDGSASVSVSGGASPYTYMWSNGSTGSTINNLVPDLYLLTVTDNNGCEIIGATFVSGLSSDFPTTINADKTNPSSAGATDGSLNIYILSVTPITSILWDNGSTSSTNSGLAAGTHCVTVTDECSNTTSACFVLEGQSCSAYIDFGLLDPIEPICSNSTTGTIQMAFDGGSSNCYREGGNGQFLFSYSWTDGQSVPSPTGLSSGEHCVTLTSTTGTCSGCTYITCINVPEHPPLSISSGTGNICNTVIFHEESDHTWIETARTNGWISITSIGGYGNSTIVWGDGNTSGFLRVISTPGEYCATISDDCTSIEQCWTINEVTVEEHCITPFFMKPGGGKGIEDGVNSVLNNWGEFSSDVEIVENWKFSLVESDNVSVNYNLINTLYNQDYGYVRIEEISSTDEMTLPEFTAKKELIRIEPITVYPNPVREELNIYFNLVKAGQTSVRILDLAGRTLKNISFSGNKGKNSYTINTSDMFGGIYLLTIDNSQATKFVIIKD